MVINGDVEQSDLRNVGVDSDLQHVIDRVVKADLQDFGVAHLTESDIVRNPLIAGFLRAMK
jgi:phosphate starvation-inducible protein PhoH